MKYNRILLKLSGEALMGDRQYGIDNDRLKEYAAEIKKVTDLGCQVAIVIGGGNIFRGLAGAAKGMDRVQGDYMGMLATVINGMALQGALEDAGIFTRLQSAIEIGADVILKGTRVDGIYDSDPEKNSDAVKFSTLTYDEVFEKDLKVMDMTAFTLSRENNLPIIVFDMNKGGNLLKIVQGENIGTLVNL